MISRRHIPELDGIRGIAVLLVVYHHYLWGPLQQSFPDAAGGMAMVTRGTGFGWMGVDLFFVLSGFLIGGILLDMQAARRDASKPFLTMRGFYIRRAFRILPVLFIFLIALICIRALPGAPLTYLLGTPDASIWPQFTFLQNYIYKITGASVPAAAGVTWSLAVEEQFYLVFPALVVLLRGRLWAVASLALALAIFSIYMRSGARGWLWPYSLTHFRMDGLAVGVLIAVFIRSRWAGPTRGWSGWTALAIGVAGFLSLISHYPTLQLGDGRIHAEVALISGSAVFIAWRWTGVRAMGWLRGRVIMWFGAISYALYLFHQLCAGIVFALVRGEDRARLDNWGDAFWVAVAFALAVGLCAVSARFIETPLRRYARRITRVSVPSDGAGNPTHPD